MAGTTQNGRPLVIVESPAKARTISRFLGDDYVIEASVGHIRDLPGSADQIPEKLKKEKWTRLGVDVENDFAPLYVVPPEKREHIRHLKKLVKDAPVVYLATDEDREGESISWHLVQELKPKAEIKRLVFHEITKEAIQRALDNPRSIDVDLVEAQETRRLVDRLYGYEVSPLLWRKIKPKLSAGRVQSVAVRLVVEREIERIRFVATDFWDLIGTFRKGDAEAPFEATLKALGGKSLAIGKDFDPDTGKLLESSSDRVHLDEAAANALVDRLAGKPAKVTSVEKKPYTERPQPPFTTSTLQQEAGRKIGFNAKRTMRAAQRLYENGFITYMRTDSTTLSQEALQAARGLIADAYGSQHVPDAPRIYKSKVKNAQEAHEAIRPAGSTFTPVDRLSADMGSDERRLYELIWKRTVACQMNDAKGHRTTIAIEVEDARFQVSGRTIEYPGFRLAYELPNANEKTDEKGASDEGRILPNVGEGDVLQSVGFEADGHRTKPPARLTEASLVKELEARGIGRPSTYASIIDTIQNRAYCFKKGSALVPTFTAFAVLRLLSNYLEWLVDYTFTAKMEDDLDEISHGRQKRLQYLNQFYNGNGRPGLKEQLVTVDGQIDPREVCTLKEFALGEFENNPIEVRVGRYGPFLAAGDVNATLPDEFAPDELNAEIAQDLLQKSAAGPKSLGEDPESGLEVFVKVGRFGPYFQLGDQESLGGEKPKMESLMKDMDPETVTLEEGLACLSLPRNLGPLTLPEFETEAGETHDVMAHNGRYGPYLKCGKATRSLGPDDQLLKVGLERAKELFSQPKARGRQAAAKKVVKELGKHPETDTPIQVLEGRYGPYVSDGSVNATVPKDEKPEEISLDRAIELLVARAAKVGKKKTKKKKKVSKKKATKKKSAAKKSTAKKKVSKKKTTKKKPSTGE